MHYCGVSLMTSNCPHKRTECLIRKDAVTRQVADPTALTNRFLTHIGLEGFMPPLRMGAWLALHMLNQQANND